MGAAERTAFSPQVRPAETENEAEYLLLPCNLLRSGENVFLDDVTVEQVEEQLKIPVKIVEEDGASLVSALLEKEAGRAHRRRQMYEQTDSSNCWTT